MFDEFQTLGFWLDFTFQIWQGSKMDKLNLHNTFLTQLLNQISTRDLAALMVGMITAYLVGI